MSGITRRLIREHVCQQVQDVFTEGEVYATRMVDARDQQPYANIFFTDGNSDYDGLQLIHFAQLTIGIHLPWQDNTDNELDDYADVIAELFENDPTITLDDIVAGFNYAGFEYGEEDDSGFIHIYSKYSVQF
tara:strand:+ start:207 stop:602 length:396 start_codon:yes stop_codon:yes gene_type:complete